jgi:hypothetical protein
VVDSAVDIWNMALNRIGSSSRVESEDERTPAAEACRLHYPHQLKRVLERLPWPWARRQTTLSEIGEQTQTYDGDASRTIFEIPYAFIDNDQLTVELLVGSTATEQTPVTHYTITQAADGNPAYVTMLSAPSALQDVRITITTERVGWDYIYALPSGCVTPVGLLIQDDVPLSMYGAESQVDFDVVINDAGNGFYLCLNYASTEFEKLEYVAHITNVRTFSSSFVEAVVWALAEQLAYALTKDAGRGALAMKMFEAAILDAAAYESNRRRQVNPVTPSLAARG